MREFQEDISERLRKVEARLQSTCTYNVVITGSLLRVHLYKLVPLFAWGMLIAVVLIR